LDDVDMADGEDGDCHDMDEDPGNDHGMDESGNDVCCDEAGSDESV
jgi:hypothetical protein